MKSPWERKRTVKLPEPEAPEAPQLVGGFKVVFVSVLQWLWGWLDVYCFFLSPLAVIGFIIFVMITLNEFGQYVQFRQAIERDGVVSSGTWFGVDEDDVYGNVYFAEIENGYDFVFIPLKYYRPETLARIRKGQVVEVRYVYPPEHEIMGVLVSEYTEFSSYTGYLGDYLWPLGLCWLIVIVRPECLLLGLVDLPEKGTKKPAGQVEKA